MRELADQLATGDSERMLSEAAAITRLARGMDHPAFFDVAAFAADCLRVPGVEVAVHEFLTNDPPIPGGRTLTEAWDLRGGALSLVDAAGGAQPIADFDDDPFSIVGWSAPGSVRTAPACIVDRLEGLDAVDVRGRIALTRSGERSDWLRILEAGAAAVVVDAPAKGLADAKRWLRFGWGGWAASARKRGFGFSLSEREGDALRARLAADPALRLAAHVDARLYEGVLPAVDARFRGESDEEVVLTAHLFEPGAVDNASGSVAVIEAVRRLAALVETGVLARPKRSIRALLTFEVFGFDRYIRAFPETVKRWKALVNVDGAGARYETTKALPTVHRSVPGWPTCLDAIAWRASEELARAAGRESAWELGVRGYYMDDCIANRARPLPGVSFGVKTLDPSLDWFLGYHSSADNAENLSAEGLGGSAAVTAATAYQAGCDSTSASDAAALCERLARLEAPLELADFAGRVRDGKNPFGLDEEVARITDMTRSRLETIGLLSADTDTDAARAVSERVATFVSKEAERLRGDLGKAADAPGDESDVARADARLIEEAGRLVPVRTSADVPSFDTITGCGDVRGRIGRDNEYAPLLDACDGARSVLDVWALALRTQDTVHPLEKTLEAFRVYEKVGAVHFARR